MWDVEAFVASQGLNPRVTPFVVYARHYSEVPIYAVCSWFSLVDRWFSLYLDTFRDCYESWVVYNFLSLCLAYVGGPGNVINRMAGKEVEPSWWAMTCCFPPLPVDGVYIRACKIGSLQFVFLKPILAVLTLLLTWAGVYGDQEIKADKAYPYIAFVYNMSYSIALFSLLMFYLGAHDLLKPYKPLLKFILVKSVIFLTFWQSILCATLVANGTLSDGEDGRALQNVLICVEMIIAAPMMLFAFPSSDYAKANVGGIMTNIGHAISLNDVVADTVHQFAPTYQEYVLHGTAGGPTRKFRMKTHIMMGQEMIAARGGNTPNSGAGGRGRGKGGRGNAATTEEDIGAVAATKASDGAARDGTNASEGNKVGARKADGGDESDTAGMMANAGFENSYGMRDVEDDLEDDDNLGGEWSDDEEGAHSPVGRAAGGGSDAAGSQATPAGMTLSPLSMESRAGLGTVFDMVADATPVVAGAGLATESGAFTRQDAEDAASGSPTRETVASVIPLPPPRRWDGTPAPPPLAPPPVYRPPARPAVSEAALDVGSPEMSAFQSADPPADARTSSPPRSPPPTTDEGM